jgi:phage terminase small subunit
MAENETSERALPPKQQKFVTALASELTVEAAANAAGIARATAYRWLEQPSVQAAVKEIERHAIEATARGLVSLASHALAVLQEAMNDPATPMATRVRAADAALNRLLQLRDLVSIEDRISAIEARLEAQS